MQILPYSPSRADVAALERLTVGASRTRLIEALVRAVTCEIGRESHQHHLLIGPRGSGKTHVLTLVAHRLSEDPELGRRVLPLSLAEEITASHPADLLGKLLEAAIEQLEQEPVEGSVGALQAARASLREYFSENDDDRALAIGLDGLERLAATLGRLLVAVVENLDSLLYAGPGLSRAGTSSSQWTFRKALLHARGLLLLAAAPSLFGGVSDSRAPFYDFFRLHQLDELPPDEMIELIERRLALERETTTSDPALRARLDGLAATFEARKPKLRGLLALTGGLPRFAHLLFDLVTRSELDTVVDTLARFLDEQTPYFQSRLDPRLVPEAELQVLDLLASSSSPLTQQEIAQDLRGFSSNAVATYLKRLRERGLVRFSGTERKNIRYDIAEPLFRVWRRFRLGRSQREQIVALTELVATVYEEAEVREDLALLPEVEGTDLRRRVLKAALERLPTNEERPDNPSPLEPLALSLSQAANPAPQTHHLFRMSVFFETQIRSREVLAHLRFDYSAAANSQFSRLAADLGHLQEEMVNSSKQPNETIQNYYLSLSRALDEFRQIEQKWASDVVVRLNRATEELNLTYRRLGEQLSDLAKDMRFQLTSAIGNSEAAREAMYSLAAETLRSLDSRALLGTLPTLEEFLPASHLEALRPFRLSAEIAAGKRAESLPEEPEEMRRAVREVLKLVPHASSSKPSETNDSESGGPMPGPPAAQ